MRWGQWLLWGFASTVLLTGLLAGSQRLRLTRMSLPYLLGTLVTPDRDRAKMYGLLLHLVGGWLFSLVYVAVFHTWGAATWWLGMVTGAVHAAFLLLVVFPALPALHPRMASEGQGPTKLRPLEPPGFLALHYGVRTPVAVLLAHMAFGALLGALYQHPARYPVPHVARRQAYRVSPGAEVPSLRSAQSPRTPGGASWPPLPTTCSTACPNGASAAFWLPGRWHQRDSRGPGAQRGVPAHPDAPRGDGGLHGVCPRQVHR